MQRLPTVTPATITAFEEGIGDCGPVSMDRLVEKLRRENPRLYEKILTIARQPGADPKSVRIGALAVYHILSAQAESDSFKT